MSVGTKRIIAAVIGLLVASALGVLVSHMYGKRIKVELTVVQEEHVQATLDGRDFANELSYMKSVSARYEELADTLTMEKDQTEGLKTEYEKLKDFIAENCTDETAIETADSLNSALSEYAKDDAKMLMKW